MGMEGQMLDLLTHNFRPLNKLFLDVSKPVLKRKLVSSKGPETHNVNTLV